MKSLSKLVLLVITCSFFIVSCDERDVQEPKMDKEVIKDNILSSKIVQDLFLDVQRGTNPQLKSENNCFEVDYDFEIDENALKRKVAVIYKNCIENGIVKNGRVIVEFEGSWEKGLKSNVIFDGFTINGYSLEGKFTTTYEALLTYKNVANLKITFEDGSFTSWKETRDIVIKEDGKLEISGSSNGVARNGKNFVRTDKKVIHVTTCPWYVGGEMELKFDDDAAYKITFGAECGSINYSYKGVNSSFKM